GSDSRRIPLAVAGPRLQGAGVLSGEPLRGRRLRQRVPGRTRAAIGEPAPGAELGRAARALAGERPGVTAVQGFGGVRSHRRTVWSALTDARRLPFSRNVTPCTHAVWPSSVFSACPLAGFHSRTLPSLLPETSNVPPGW